MRISKAVAEDLRDDLVTESRRLAEINEGDWGAFLDAADAVDRAIAEADVDVLVPEEVPGDFLPEEDGAPCCPDPGCPRRPCTFPGYADNH